jgi:cyclopropane-fatty-acyl-phospholipid synthase
VHRSGEPGKLTGSRREIPEVEVSPPASHANAGQPVAAAIGPVVRRILGRDLPFRLRAWDGSETGPPDAEVTVVVHSPDALRRMLWAPGELGLARAHVAGELDIEGDIFGLLGTRDLVADPTEHYEVRFTPATVVHLAKVARDLGALRRPLPPPPEEMPLPGLLESAFGGRLHTKQRDAASVSYHYDVGNDFYGLVLGPTWTYSCAYWPTPDATLEQAQAAKYEIVARKLGLAPGMRLLDVGCGWGGMALHAARHHGVSVVGVTLSQEQRAKAIERVEEAGLSGQIEIRLQDYRDIADGPFDAVSSIGMFEHVGREQMRRYLADLHGLLRPGGRLLNHAISRPEPESRPAVRDRSFVGRYVFPDAALLEVGTVVSAMQGVGLEVRDVQSLREHYARTLRAWVANLEARWDEAQRLVGPGRARVWRLYMAGSALGFEQNRISVHQVLAVRAKADGSSDMPATREGVDVQQPLSS